MACHMHQQSAATAGAALDKRPWGKSCEYPMYFGKLAHSLANLLRIHAVLVRMEQAWTRAITWLRSFVHATAVMVG